MKNLPWPKGESFLTFLDKYSISQKLYFDLEKDKELCSEIEADRTYYLYTEDDGSFKSSFNSSVSDDIQIHI